MEIPVGPRSESAFINSNNPLGMTSLLEGLFEKQAKWRFEFLAWWNASSDSLWKRILLVWLLSGTMIEGVKQQDRYTVSELWIRPILR